MNTKRLVKLLVCALLIAAAVAVLASCGETVGPGKNSEYKDEVIDKLPADLDYDGEKINFFHWGSEFVTWELTSDGSTGDIVEKAVNKRNNSVQERLGVTLNYIKGEVPAEVFMPEVLDQVMSGSKDYDIIVGVQCTAGPVAAQGAFKDMQNSKYIDFTQSYWNEDYNTALSVNDKRYMLGGDISLTTTAWTSAMFFDLELFENQFGDADEFYEFVNGGGWTLDELAVRCRQCYSDLNGNGQKDVDDRYGIAVMGTGSVTDQYLFSSGVTYSTRDENNIPQLNMKNEKTIEFIDKFYNLVYNNEGSYRITADNEQYTDDMRTVFGAGLMHSAVENRGKEEDFGIIPMPKLNSKEEKYHAWLSDCTAIYAVPVTEDDERMDMISAVLECMASETSRTCLPAYYEQALKQKYVRDSWSAKMLDLIHDGETTDFVAVYSLSLGEIGTIMRQLIGYDEPNFVSAYESKEAGVQAKLQDLFNAFEAHASGEFTPVTSEEPSSGDAEPQTISANDISSEWKTFGTKYKLSGVWAKEDMSEHFAFRINGDNEIEVESPDIKICGGYYPTAAICSLETLPLKDLSVKFHVDDGFSYSYDTEGWASSFSVMWTDKPIPQLSYYLEGPGTNGLREIVPEDSKGVSVHFMGAAGATDTTANYTYIVLYDGTGAAPEIDHRLGYRFTNIVDTDIGQPTTIEFREDDELGYVTLINGTEYRTGIRGETIYDIDLNVLKDVEEGYLTVGGESRDKTFINFTLSEINGAKAGSYFD